MNLPLGTKMTSSRPIRIKVNAAINSLAVAAFVILLSVTPSNAIDSPVKAGASQHLKTIIVNNYHPYTFINDKGEPDGFSVEIARAVTRAMDLDLEIRADKWDQAMKKLEAGSIDMLPMMAYSPERDIIFDFSVPHTIAYDAIFIKKGNSGLRKLKDLSGKTVIVMNKDIAHSYLLSSGLSKTMNLHLVDSLPEALKQLSAGKGDAAIMPKLVGIVTAKKLNISDIETSSQLIDAYTRPFSFAVKEGNQALLERLNQGLNIIKSTSQYDVIYKKWFGALEDPHLHWKTAIKYGAVAILILFGFLVWNVILKQQVKAKTEHLEAEIIKRMATEDSLKTLAMRQSAILYSVPDIIMEVDVNKVYTWANSAGHEFFGEDVIGRDAAYYFDGAQNTYDVVQPLFDNVGKTIYVESWQRRKDGEVRLLAWWCKSLEDENGAVTGTLSTARDITDHKLMEASLRAAKDTLQEQCEELQVNEESLRDQNDELQSVEEMLREQINEYEASQKLLKISEERLYQLAEQSRTFSWEVDAQGLYTFISPVSEVVIGYHPDEIVGKIHFYELHPEEGREEFTKVAFEVFEQKNILRNLVNPMQTKDNNLVWVSTNGFPLLNTDGTLLGYRGSDTDITERKHLEEERLVLEQQFQQAQKLESLGVLAGGIAHDFNNILAIIMGYCSLIKMNYEETNRHIPEIEKAAERAAGLCRQMLAYAGKAQINQTRINLWMLVDEMVNMLKATLPQNVAFKSSLATNIPFVYGDASQIRQIVMNLLINASEAIGEAQGEIHVSLSKIMQIAGESEKDHQGRAIPPGRYVCLEVADNGCGMDGETKLRIFEPFYTTKFTGRGLGMSAVLGIITAHNGALQLHSQPGQGTIFKVYLPVSGDPTEDEAFQQNSSAPWKGRGTILLVEDEAQVTLIVRAMLIAMGFTVIEASNGEEALEIYHTNASYINLVLTDIGMPVMDGYALFRELKTSNPALPIIISSGFGDADITSRIDPENIAGLVSKPYNFEQLRDVLKRVMICT